MEKVVTMKAIKMSQFLQGLNVSEIKLVLVIAYYLSSKGKTLFVNNAENREFLALYGFKRTPVRVSTVLSSLTRKKMLVKEAQGVYSLPKKLFNIPIEESINND